MTPFTVRCVSIEDVCALNGLDVGDVMEAVCGSDVCFGTNADTLMYTSQLERALGRTLDWGGLDDVYVSLGC